MRITKEHLEPGKSPGSSEVQIFPPPELGAGAVPPPGILRYRGRGADRTLDDHPAAGGVDLCAGHAGRSRVSGLQGKVGAGREVDHAEAAAALKCHCGAAGGAGKVLRGSSGAPQGGHRGATAEDWDRKDDHTGFPQCDTTWLLSVATTGLEGCTGTTNQTLGR